MKKRFCFLLLFLLIPVIALADFTSAQIAEYSSAILTLEVIDSQGQVTATGSGLVVYDNQTVLTNYSLLENQTSFDLNFH